MGRKKRPIYAVVAADARSPRDGRYIEDLGRYRPLDEPTTITLKEDRVMYWLKQGAQPSDTVRNLLSREGLMLALHLERKGKTEDEIAQAVEAHREAKAEGGEKAMTAKERRQAALEAERARVQKEEEEERKRQAEIEAQRQKEAEEAKKKAAEERQAAAEAAKAEQADANEAQAAEDSEGDAAETAEAEQAETAEAPAEEAKADAEEADAAEAKADDAEAAEGEGDEEKAS